jgi:hypothetical protein
MPDIEEEISRAMREGKFSNLAGKGKPLRLEDNHLADPEWRLAYHLLHENGFSLPWLELRQEIEAEAAQILETIERAWTWRCTSLHAGEPALHAESTWRRAREHYNEQVRLLNKHIFEYNLQTPSTRFQMMGLDAEKTLQQIESQD